MGLFGGGGGLTAESKAYNNALRDYNTFQMNTNRDIITEARPYVNMTAADDIAYDPISGQYLNANPYINQVAGNVSQQIMDQYNKSYIPSALSSYASSGRFGSGLFQKTLADTQSQMNQDVANAMNNLYYQNYSTERQLQEQARQRAAAQYDPLNRYTSYSGLLNAYQAAQPQAEYEKKKRGWGQALLTVGGAALGSIVPGVGTALGATIGSGVGKALSE